MQPILERAIERGQNAVRKRKVGYGLQGRLVSAFSVGVKRDLSASLNHLAVGRLGVFVTSQAASSGRILEWGLLEYL